MLKIGGFLKARMEDKDIPQKYLAEMVKRDQRSISNYCCDVSYPDLDTLARLCQILEIDMNHLLQIQSSGNPDLLLQNEQETRLIKAFRGLPKHKRVTFMNTVLMMMKLLDDK